MAEGPAHIVAISGKGIAANSCAHLLRSSGLEPVLDPSVRPPVPGLLLSDAALALLRDIFGRPDLFANRHRISRRIVSWGGGEPQAMPHGAVVLGETDLDAELAAAPSTHSPATPANFTLYSAPPFPQQEMQHFGSRKAVATKVLLRHEEDASSCWMEAVNEGWLFMIPTGTGDGWLLTVGGPAEELIDQSRHLAPRLILLDAETPSPAFETAPRMLTSLRGPDWLACGTAAIAFDPICGDGTAQAVREAILACAVIGAIREGQDSQSLLDHYEAMLIAGMRRHLRLCAQFYQSGSNGPWWPEQVSALAQGFNACTNRLAMMPEPRYELHGLRLVPRGEAA